MLRARSLQGPWLALAIALAIPAFSAELRPPIRKQGFMKAVEIGGLTPDELIRYIQDLGVDFRLTEEERTKLAKSGLDARVLRTVDQSFRAPAPPPAPIPAPKPAVIATAPEIVVPNTAPMPKADPQQLRITQISFGSPVTKEQLSGYLKEGIASGVLEGIVERRGIEFVMTPQIAQELKSAGATRELLGALALTKATKADPPPLPTPVVATAPAPVPPPPTAAAPVPPQTSPVTLLGPNGQPMNQASAVLIHSGFKPANPITKVRPEFPSTARSTGGGVAVMELEVAEDGSVAKVKALRGPIQLIYAAQQAARKWTFEPATLNGKPVRVTTQVEFVFKSGGN